MTKKTLILSASILFLSIGVAGFLATSFLAPPNQKNDDSKEQVKEMMRQTFEKNKELELENDKLHERHVKLLQTIDEKNEEIKALEVEQRSQIGAMKKLARDQNEEVILKKQIKATKLRLEEIEYGTQNMIKILRKEATPEEERSMSKNEVDRELEELGETLMIDELPVEDIADKALKATRELASLVSGVEKVEEGLRQKITDQKFEMERLDAESLEVAVMLESAKDELASQQILLEDSLALIDRLENEKKQLEQEFHEKPLPPRRSEPAPVIEEEIVELPPEPEPVPELEVPLPPEKEKVDFELEELEEIIEEVEDTDPDLKDQKTLAKENKKLRKKLDKLKKTIKKDRIAFYYNLGLAYTYAGLYPEAIKMYEKVLAMDPHDAPTHYNLGILYDDHMNKTEKGLEHYQKYIDYSKDQEKRRKVMNWMDIASRKYGSGRETRRESAEQSLKRLLFTNTR